MEHADEELSPWIKSSIGQGLTFLLSALYKYFFPSELSDAFHLPYAISFSVLNDNSLHYVAPFIQKNPKCFTAHREGLSRPLSELSSVYAQWCHFYTRDHTAIKGNFF